MAKTYIMAANTARSNPARREMTTAGIAVEIQRCMKNLSSNYEELFSVFSQALTTSLEAASSKKQEPEEPQAQLGKFLTIQEACKFLKITRPTLDKHVNTGRIHKTKVGRRVLINESELIEALSEGSIKKYGR